MSEAMSNPTEWMQFYSPNFSSGSTTTTTVATQPTAVTSSPTAETRTTARLGQVEPAGRVSKPARRRTRASRRTPTTLLSTDTSNFRAMVQQFTGGPAGSHHHHGFSVANPTARPAPPAGYLYYQQQSQQAQQLFPYMYGGGPAGGTEGFPLGVGAPARPSSDSAPAMSENLRSNNFIF